MTGYLLAAIAVVAILSSTLLFPKNKGRRKKTASNYINALHKLLDGNQSEAIEKLKQTVKDDSENIMAYIILGNVLRDTGSPNRAAKIHRNLLVRRDLTNTEIDMVLQQLIRDYRTAKLPDKATEMAERLSNRNKKDVQIQQLLLSLYEEMGDWDKALFYRQHINKWEKKKNQDILALYKIQAGLASIERNTEKEGRIRFREAIKLDKNCIPAYLYLGDSYKRMGRDEDAEKIWKEFTDKNSEMAHLVFDRLRNVLFDMGKFSEMEEIYKHVIKKKPGNPIAALNLAGLYKKQGKLEMAEEMCQKVLDNHPDSSQAKFLLVDILKLKGNTELALSNASKFLEKAKDLQSNFFCLNCDFESSDPLWFCPRCHHWKTFL